MAKKTKQRSVSTTSAARNESGIDFAKGSSRAFSTEFNPDYTYVKQDLKKIAILAVVFVVVLIALSFFLN
jgi:hypothetical protein